MLKELLIYLIIATVLSLIIGGASYILAIRRPETEKVSAYECGFEPFTDARKTFEVRFFLVGILFIIFDLEIALLFPFAMVYNPVNYWAVMAFLVILTVGFIFEWAKGALEWE